MPNSKFNIVVFEFQLRMLLTVEKLAPTNVKSSLEKKSTAGLEMGWFLQEICFILLLHYRASDSGVSNVLKRTDQEI